jgi:glycosyltransferase involved in cell wall biosynthesis
MIKFSIVIPVYNARNTIVETLYSCINQTYTNFEILIIDDCSDDDTIDIIKKKFNLEKISIFQFEINKGVSMARNFGWEKATGDYIAFLDSDDTWHLKKLEILNQILENSEIKFIGHNYTEIDYELSNKNSTIINELQFTKLLFRNYFNTSCFVIQRNVNERFQENSRHTEDHDLILRISEKYKVYHIQSNLTLLGRPQLSKGGLSENKSKMRIGEILMYFNLCKRKKYFFVALPFLISFSLIKHVIKIIR